MTTAAILQPSYLSWPGHFYWMMNCDVFILLDDVQFTRHDWRNRNYIKTPNGKQLLTVPVNWYGNSYCPINEVAIAKGQNWAKKHLNALRSAYGKAPYSKKYFPYFEEIFSKDWHLLCDLTITTMKDIAAFLDVRPRFVISSELNIETENSTEKLVKLCQAVGADVYLAGRRGYDNYIEHKLFDDAGIKIIVKDYAPREYPQLWGEFISHLSVVDLLFNCGHTSKHLIEDRLGSDNEGLEKNSKDISLVETKNRRKKIYSSITKPHNVIEKSAPTIFCWKNEYDSRFFKRDIFSFSPTPVENATPGKLVVKFKDTTQWPNGLIIGRIPIYNIQTLQDAIVSGFEILCPMADLELNLQDRLSDKYDGEIGVATPEDNTQVMDIASKVFSNTRVHRERTTATLANEYHKVWAKNCLSGNQADIVLISGKPHVDGFIALSYHPQVRAAKIVLIGVLSDKRGMGIGKRLLKAGIDWAQRAGALEIRTRTEADNVSAIMLYLESGFKLTELSVYLRKDNAS